MSLYKILSDEIIKAWEKSLEKVTLSLINRPTEESLNMFLLTLYEYLVISIGFTEIYGGREVEHVVLSLTDLKKLPKTRGMSRCFLDLKNTADSIRHTCYEEDAKETFQEFFKKTNYDSIWDNFLDNCENTKKFLKNKERLEVVFKEICRDDDFEESCKAIAIELLGRNSSEKTGFNLSDASDILCKRTLCSKGYAEHIMFEIVKLHNVMW